MKHFELVEVRSIAFLSTHGAIEMRRGWAFHPVMGMFGVKCRNNRPNQHLCLVDLNENHSKMCQWILYIHLQTMSLFQLLPVKPTQWPRRVVSRFPLVSHFAVLSEGLLWPKTSVTVGLLRAC